MILRGILDFSLGGFLCLRGFAPLGELYDVSDADPGFQRELLPDQRDQFVTFLREARAGKGVRPSFVAGALGDQTHTGV